MGLGVRGVCTGALAAYVLHRGLQDPRRSRWKLMLSCTLIVTSVVPPELPMELSLAVNTSLLMLHRAGIFCTEPFRIPFAGALDTCCFDKTGTLTADVMIMDGIHTGSDPVKPGGEPGAVPPITPPSALGAADTPESRAALPAQLVLAGCHSLVWLDRDLVGDSMEKAALEAVGWQPRQDNAGASKGRRKVQVVARYPFLSALKRMSAVVDVAAGGHAGYYGVCKGAPEELRNMLAAVPDEYDETFRRFSRAGSRVISLCIRKMPPKMPISRLKSLKREEVEREMTFAGFAVFSCPIREDALPTVQRLQRASQRVVMITGDNELTAAWVARQLGIAPLPHRFLRHTHNGAEWVDPDHPAAPPLSSHPASPESLAASHSL
eukprot:gene6514-22831_t